MLQRACTSILNINGFTFPNPTDPQVDLHVHPVAAPSKTSPNLKYSGHEAASREPREPVKPVTDGHVWGEVKARHIRRAWRRAV